MPIAVICQCRLEKRLVTACHVDILEFIVVFPISASSRNTSVPVPARRQMRTRSCRRKYNPGQYEFRWRSLTISVPVGQTTPLFLKMLWYFHCPAFIFCLSEGSARVCVSGFASRNA